MNNTFRTLIVAAAAAAVVLPGASAQAMATPVYKKPKIFGTTFQPDTGHDFSKRIHPRRNGILRGWITTVQGQVAEYEPIRWKKGTKTEGYFVGPPEGDVQAYASPISSSVRFLSAHGCKASMTDLTVDRRTGLGNKRCSRSTLIKRAKKPAPRPALITVHRGHIVQVQEIFTP
ncbi:hypothetical protein [Streptosporangium sp. KLBMP 9127]|nr:hypothetical protein [Streptosporangium sp. KLBMP 9127]